MDWLPESLLEMHFHRAIVKKYERRYGRKCLRLLKPSPQREAWVGFDQGWTKTDLSERELFDQLKSTISTGRSSVSKFYVGEFLQFKIVQKVTRKSSSLPAGFTTPYYRSALSLKPNKLTGISQHETLCRLSRIKRASVYYACPMIFDQDKLWDEPELNLLRFVDVKTAPKGWITTKSHHIVFQSPTTSVPMWCSDPVPGIALSMAERWEQENQAIQLTGNQTVSFIQNISEIVRGRDIENIYQDESFQGDLFQGELFPFATRYLPESMSLYEFQE